MYRKMVTLSHKVLQEIVFLKVGSAKSIVCVEHVKCVLLSADFQLGI